MQTWWVIFPVNYTTIQTYMPYTIWHGTFMVELREAIEHRTKTKKITDWTETDPSQFETHRTRKKSINHRRPIVSQREWPNSIKKITTSPYVKVSTIYLISFLFPQHFEKQTKLPLISYWTHTYYVLIQICKNDFIIFWERIFICERKTQKTPHNLHVQIFYYYCYCYTIPSSVGSFLSSTEKILKKLEKP